jgi:hypothetical protein
MTDPLTLALGEDALIDLHNELDDLRSEVQAHRDGVGHLAEDPMHAGQPVHVAYRYDDGEPVFHLQRTHQDMPLWFCPADLALTIGAKDGSEPARCVKCGAGGDLGPALYEEQAGCRSWSASYGGQYDGPCLITGSDGCECDDS